jgi:hypothetical protein
MNTTMVTVIKLSETSRKPEVKKVDKPKKKK